MAKRANAARTDGCLPAAASKYAVASARDTLESESLKTTGGTLEASSLELERIEDGGATRPISRAFAARFPDTPAS